MNFWRRRLGGRLYFLPKYRCGTIYMNILNTDFANFWKHITMFQPLFWYQSFSRFHWKLMWSAPFARKSRISWHAKVDVLSYTVFINHYDTFFSSWLIDCLVVSCFTSTRTIVGINLGSKLKVCVCWGV